MNVSAIIVTRGDQNLLDVLDSLPQEWERIVWNNGAGTVGQIPGTLHLVPDFSVYGRYAAIEYASHDLIYVQDDDCVVSDPRAIVNAWWEAHVPEFPDQVYHVVCNMPPEFRHGFYEEHALVGFGACFHRDAPERAFRKFWLETVGHEVFHRTCDVLFTALTPRVLIDVPVRNLPWASGKDRMYRQPGHQAERGRMLELAFRAKDAFD